MKYLNKKIYIYFLKLRSDNLDW